MQIVGFLVQWLKSNDIYYRDDSVFTYLKDNLVGCTGKDVDKFREVQGMLGRLVDKIGFCKVPPDVIRVCRPKVAVECAADLSFSFMDNYDYMHLVCS